MVEIDFNFLDFYFAFLEVLSHGNKAKELEKKLRGEEPISEYKLFFQRYKFPVQLIKLVGKFINREPKRFNMLMNHTGK